MKKSLVLMAMLITSALHAQEKYIGLTHDSLLGFHRANFETVMNNDTALLVKDKSTGKDYRFFKFDTSGICYLATKNMPYYDDILNLETKLTEQGYQKSARPFEMDFLIRKITGVLYTRGKENYVMMSAAICPGLASSTRTVVYFKKKK